MRTWIAAHAISTCGYCGARINEGDPVQVVELRGLSRKALRCLKHAQGDVDWDAVNDSRGGPKIREIARGGFTRVSRIRTGLDAKLKAAMGDDD